ncbi:MAG: hypothetical protein ACREM2_06995, partial [Vulcanimicrobiaceae bacterium]
AAARTATTRTPAAPTRGGDASGREVVFKRTFQLHIADRDFYTTESYVDAIRKAIAGGGTSFVTIVARTEREPKPIELIVNVAHIAFIRASN